MGPAEGPQAGASWTSAPVTGVVGGACCPRPGPCPVRAGLLLEAVRHLQVLETTWVPFPNMCNDFFTDGLLPLGWSVLFWTSVSRETRESQASERLGCPEELQEAALGAPDGGSPTVGSAAEGSADGGDNGDLGLGARPAQEAQRPMPRCALYQRAAPPHPLTTLLGCRFGRSLLVAT